MIISFFVFIEFILFCSALFRSFDLAVEHSYRQTKLAFVFTVLFGTFVYEYRMHKNILDYKFWYEKGKDFFNEFLVAIENIKSL